MNYSLLKKQTLGAKKERYLSTFLLALLVAALFFVPYIILDKGYFLFYGDFNVQQIPFYQRCHEAIRSGMIGWDWNTDLGVNFIGSYSFYTLGSPFFWLTLPFPNSWVPYMMGPLLILKFACSALTAYCFIRRFTRTPESARIGALLYAFSGFSVYNIFFNHFHEAIIFFPLLLLSVELLITENRRGFFAAMVAITAISNYFFFFGMVVFTVIYWFVRMLTGCYKMKLSRFMWFVFEAVIGLLVSAAILLPTCYAVLGNSRISEISVGWNAIMYGKEQIYLNILECFFFPPDIPARPVFFPDADVKWSSLGGWLPLFSMVGVFAWLQQKKRTWQRRLIGISIFMALVPILNSSFYMFNNAYYARWYYMPILIMCLVTAQCTEDTEIDWKVPFKWVTGITVAATAVFAVFPREITDGKITKWGLFTNTDDFYIYRFAATAAIAVVSLLILGLLLKLIKSNRKQFITTATAIICIISVIYSAYFIGTGKSHSYDSDVVINHLIEGEVTLPDDKDTYRIDIFDGIDNTGMFLGYSTINAFHSVVPTSVTEFWEYVGEDRGVASRPTTESYAARALLGVKYLLVREDGDSFTDDLGEPAMPGFTFYSHEEGYDVYINDNHLPMGFAYDYYMTEAQAESVAEEDRSNAMLKAIILTDDQVGRFGGWLENLSDYKEKPDTPANPVVDDIIDRLPETLPDGETSSGSSVVTGSSSVQSVANGSDLSNPSSGSLSDVSTDSTLSDQTLSSDGALWDEQYYDDFGQISDAMMTFFYDEEELSKDVKALRETAITSFTRTKKGFESEIALEKDNLVFFSVPYDEGWSATVNGTPVKVEKVNAGFMAVPAPAGENTITFTYTTPGLKPGIIVTIFAVVVLIVYILIFLIIQKRRGSGYTEYPEGDELIKKFKHDVAEELMIEAEARQDESEQNEAPADDSSIYGEGANGFNRGFWINVDTDDQPEEDLILSAEQVDNLNEGTNDSSADEPEETANTNSDDLSLDSNDTIAEEVSKEPLKDDEPSDFVAVDQDTSTQEVTEVTDDSDTDAKDPTEDEQINSDEASAATEQPIIENEEPSAPPPPKPKERDRRTPADDILAGFDFSDDLRG